MFVALWPGPPGQRAEKFALSPLLVRCRPREEVRVGLLVLARVGLLALTDQPCHRKTTLTTEVAGRLALLLRSGVPLATTAVNVHRATLYRWLARPEPEFVAFRERVRQARANGELALIAAVLRQSETRWQTAAWILEREYPERYGRPGDRPVTDGEPRPFR